MESLKTLIEKEFGEQIKYPFQCAALEQAIFDKSGERIGVSTLKRIFGFTTAVHIPRQSTLDVLARYVGYNDYTGLISDIGNSCEISCFTPVETIESEDLKPGETVKIAYNPNRALELKYLGDSRFEVVDSKGSKLQRGDLLKISQLALNFQFLVTEVVRDGFNLGSYVGARQGGLTEIYM